MRRLALALLLAVSAPCLAESEGEALQRAFIEAMQAQEAGDLAHAESAFRDLLKATNAPRVKLELARTLYLEGKYAEAKPLFSEVSKQADTPWRVRDNIAHFVRDIEERTGYLKFGMTVVTDSNPRSLAAQKEFAIGDLRATPTEAPKKMHGLRYSARGWLPLEPIGGAGYLDVGGVKNLTSSGRIRVKPGMEFGAFGGHRLYRFPYIGLDAVLAQTNTSRLTGELKVGKVKFADFGYLDATNTSAAVSARKLVSSNATVTLSASLENSSAKERPYSYYGWDLGPGIDSFWPEWTLMVGARASVGSRQYAATDPMFGERRVDAKRRLELSVGNKRWRWRDHDVSLVASLEENRSNIGFYSYRKTNVSVVVE
jgi:hypothetical protein